jgi:hypothetical protein
MHRSSGIGGGWCIYILHATWMDFALVDEREQNRMQEE